MPNLLWRKFIPSSSRLPVWPAFPLLAPPLSEQHTHTFRWYGKQSTERVNTLGCIVTGRETAGWQTLKIFLQFLSAPQPQSCSTSTNNPQFIRHNTETTKALIVTEHLPVLIPHWAAGKNNNNNNNNNNDVCFQLRSNMSRFHNLKTRDQQWCSIDFVDGCTEKKSQSDEAIKKKKNR